MDDGLPHSFNPDPELIRLLIEHAERLAECLRQFKSIDSRDHGSSDVNAALQGIVTAAGDIVKLSKPSGESQRPTATPLDIAIPESSTRVETTLSAAPSESVSPTLTEEVPLPNRISPSDRTTFSISKTTSNLVQSQTDTGIAKPTTRAAESTAKAAKPITRGRHSEPNARAQLPESSTRVQRPESRISRAKATGASHANAAKKRDAATGKSSAHPPKRKRVVDSASRSREDQAHALEIERLTRKLRSNDKLLPESWLGTIRSSACAGLVLRAAAVQGGLAIQQFCSLINERRSREAEAGILHLTGQGIDRALQLSRSIAALTRRTGYSAFLIRLAQYHMAEAVEETKMGRMRVDPIVIRKAMERFGFKSEEKTQFLRALNQGRQWWSLCGSFPGLLCLIPLQKEEPYLMGPKDYLDMNQKEMDEFTVLVLSSRFLKQLNGVCETLQAIIMGTKPDSTFRWEREHPQLRTCNEGMDENILATLIQPEPECGDNFILPGDLDKWPKPAAWREEWPWPLNPLAVAPSEQRQCGLCDERACSCVTDWFRTTWPPRIKSYGKQGVGLQAIGRHEGEVTYRRGDLIGKLSGRLQPAGTYAANSPWVVEMHRPDLDPAGDGDVQPICQIYLGGAASIFRNLNHSCRASVRMVPVMASGAWVMAIEVLRDIRHGEQLTADFGKRYLQDQGLSCECEQCAEETSQADGRPVPSLAWPYQD